MHRILFAAIAVGTGLAVGALSYAYTMGYDVFALELWVLGFKAFFDSPTIIVNQALGSEEAPFFQAILMMVASVFFLVLAVVGFSLTSIGRALSEQRRKKNLGGTLKTKFRDVAPKSSGRASAEFMDNDTMDDPKSSGPSTIGRITDALSRQSSKKNAREFDQALDEENAPSKGRGFFAKAAAAMSKKPSSPSVEDPLEQPLQNEAERAAARAMLGKIAQDTTVEDTNRISKKLVVKSRTSRGKATARIRIAEESKWAGFGGMLQAGLDKFWDGGLAAIKVKVAEMSAKKRPVVMDASGTDTASKTSTRIDDGEIMAWFASVQSGSRPTQELVREAAGFRALLTQEEREKFAERNSIDGAFVVRLIDSWAVRTDTDAVAEDGSEDRATLRAAIRAVHMERVGLAKIDEASVPEEFRHDMEEKEPEETIDDDEEWSREEAALLSPEMPPAAEGDGEADDAIGPSLARAAARMRAFCATCLLVRAGEEPWPPHIDDDEDRLDEIHSIGRDFENLMFAMDEEDVLRIASEEGDEALDWLVQETNIVEVGFEAYVAKILADSEEEPEGGWSDEASDGGEASDPFGDAKDDGDEAKEPFVPDTEVNFSEDEDDVEPAVEAPSVEEEDQASIEDEPILPTPEPEPETDVHVDPESEDPAVEEEPEAEEAPAQDIAPAPDEPMVVPMVQPVPKSVGISNEEEMELASTLIQEWGVASKEIGATGGKMMHFVHQRSGEKLTSLGFVHIVILWKDKPNVSRINVVFRYLPEGNWRVDPSAPGRFLEESGDWVEVPPLIFQSDEVRNALLAVHVHGPGVATLDTSASEGWSARQWLVVDETPTSAAMAERLESA